MNDDLIYLALSVALAAIALIRQLLADRRSHKVGERLTEMEDRVESLHPSEDITPVRQTRRALRVQSPFDGPECKCGHHEGGHVTIGGLTMGCKFLHCKCVRFRGRHDPY